MKRYGWLDVIEAHLFVVLWIIGPPVALLWTWAMFALPSGHFPDGIIPLTWGIFALAVLGVCAEACEMAIDRRNRARALRFRTAMMFRAYTQAWGDAFKSIGRTFANARRSFDVAAKRYASALPRVTEEL